MHAHSRHARGYLKRNGTLSSRMGCPHHHHHHPHHHHHYCCCYCSRELQQTCGRVWRTAASLAPPGLARPKQARHGMHTDSLNTLGACTAQGVHIHRDGRCCSQRQADCRGRPATCAPLSPHPAYGGVPVHAGALFFTQLSPWRMPRRAVLSLVDWVDCRSISYPYGYETCRRQLL
jgi:hypothetical protein